jgi:predicted RNA-binding protein YlxR (DUF448 family)
VICGTKTAKRDLVRVVRTPDGACVVDTTGRMSGRGAYVCHQDSCWQKALKGGRLAHALKGEIGAEDREKLEGFAAALTSSGTQR